MTFVNIADFQKVQSDAPLIPENSNMVSEKGDSFLGSKMLITG